MSADPAKDSDMSDSNVTIQIVMHSEPFAVRNGLRELFAGSPLCDLTEETRGTVEIVLAEALNNIVEHAYAASEGDIEVRLCHHAPDLWCEISDVGLPMPNGTIPVGQLANIDPDDDLPEGGFGWFLIRSLAQDLAYCRVHGRNQLRFRLQVA
jgi:serine/threonine-protein kinase RsbW